VSGHEGDAAVYSHPRIYDLLHTPGTAEEVDGLELLAGKYATVTRRGPGIRSWLEPACGTGRYLRVLARRAARRKKRVRLVGVDLNEPMLEFARERIRGATFVRADMRSLAARALGGAFDGAFVLQNSIRHLQTDADVVKHLAAVRSCLSAGGVYLVGTALEPASDYGESDDHYEARRGTLVVRDDVQYVPLPPETSADADGHEQVYSYVSARRGRSRTPVAEIVSSYRLWCCSPPRWARLVAKAGLEQVAACELDGTDLGLDHRGYAVRVLRRPRSPRR
jgi:SAM-dependent methyltransferase